MALGAEVAQLVVELKLKDNLTGGLNAVNSRLNTFGTRVARVGSAIGTMGGKIKNAITGPLGLIGLGGAIFGLERFLSGAVTKANAFGQAVAKVSAITGESAQATSALVDTLDFYGIAAETQTRVVGMAEKNLGNLTKTTATAKKFAKDYGLQLLDGNGKVKDFNALLLDSADFFNDKAIPAQTRAAALAKIYGRNWQELIPVFTQGSKKLKEGMADAIKLSDEDLANMGKFKQASREWDDALGDLQITIGAKLLPALTGLAKGASKFVRENSDKIVKFFQDAAKFAQRAGAAFQQYVVPAFQTIADAWSKVPPDLKKILIGGFIANKALKATIGIGAGDIAGALTKGLGGLLGRGSSPANAMWVKMAGAPLGGAGGAGGVVAGGTSKLVKGLAALSVLGDILAVGITHQAVNAESTAQARDIHETQKVFVAQSPPISALQNALAGVNQGIKDIQSNPLLTLVQGDALNELQRMRGELQTQVANATAGFSLIAREGDKNTSRLSAGFQSGLGGVKTAIKNQKPPSVSVTVPVSVSVRDAQKNAAISIQYGKSYQGNEKGK